MYENISNTRIVFLSQLKLCCIVQYVYYIALYCRVQKNVAKSEQVPSTSGEKRSSRHSAVRNPPNAEITPTAMRDLNCIICDNKSHKGDYTKYRISESDRAKAFLAATNYFQDAVYTRTCDLQDENSVFGADLYYHSICMKKVSEEI